MVVCIFWDGKVYTVIDLLVCECSYIFLRLSRNSVADVMFMMILSLAALAFPQYENDTLV